MSEERVSRNAGFALLAQLVGAVLTGGITIFLARVLSADEYGYFTFGMSVVTIATLFADFGVTSSAGRFLAERRDDPRAASQVFRTALRLKLHLSLLAATAMFALAGPIAEVFGAPDAAWTLRGLALALFAQAVFLLLLGAFIALGVIRYNVVLATAESVAEALAVVTFVLLTASATAAALGRATGYAVGLVVGLFVASRVFGDLRRSRRDGALPEPGGADRRRLPVVTRRMILGYAGPLLLVDAAFRVFSSIDVLFISAIIGAGAPVATYGLALQLTYFLSYPGAALSSAVSPRLARSREGPNLTLFTQSVRYLVILQVLLTAPLLIWPEAIVELLFGDKYPDAPAVLRTLIPFVFLTGLSQITTLSVNYLGYARRRVPIALAMLAVNVALNLLLLPWVGIVGAAIAMSVSYAIWVPAHVWILHQKAGLRLAPLLQTLARALLAGALLVGVLALIGTGDVPIPLMLVGAIVGPAVYLGALFALRELTLDDVAVVRRVFSRTRSGSTSR